MQETIRKLVVRFLGVPAAPHVPTGSPDSIRVFRAAPNYYRLCLIRWGIGQGAALSLLIGALVMLHVMGGLIHIWRNVHVWALLIHFMGLAGYLLLMPFTFAMVWLDFDLRWYIVTDRSLRIRSGLIVVREMTMTFANIQQITIHQGPLQRWLGLYDLEVSTAGGSAPHAGHSHGRSATSHVGYFRGINNAPEVRDMMLERLRVYRDAGLGDPEESEKSETRRHASSSELQKAAETFRFEAAALRREMENALRPTDKG